MASAAVLELTDADLETTLAQSRVPVLVDFWGLGCAPCARMAPILDEVAADFGGRLVVAKVNTSVHQEAASRLGVQAVPTMMVFKNGAEVDRIRGAVRKDVLVEAIERAM